jgi:hypothetical protein
VKDLLETELIPNMIGQKCQKEFAWRVDTASVISSADDNLSSSLTQCSVLCTQSFPMLTQSQESSRET